MANIGYSPVFASIYSGSLCGQWPAAALMATLLPLCDKNGEIDIHPKAISSMTGWPMDLLQAGLEQLTAPDPDSRSPECEGRRLILLKPGVQSWGWLVVNYDLYREKARLMAKASREVAEGKNAARMAERNRPPLTAADRRYHEPLTAADRRYQILTAADPLSNPNPNPYPLKRKKEREGAIAPIAPTPGLDQASWDRWEAYRKDIKKPLRPTSTPAAQRAMAKFGLEQAGVVEHSIANGYQGLFEPKSIKGKPARRWE